MTSPLLSAIAAERTADRIFSDPTQTSRILHSDVASYWVFLVDDDGEPYAFVYPTKGEAVACIENMTSPGSSARRRCQILCLEPRVEGYRADVMSVP